jgi:hypothetical protein
MINHYLAEIPSPYFRTGAENAQDIPELYG